MDRPERQHSIACAARSAGLHPLRIRPNARAAGSQDTFCSLFSSNITNIDVTSAFAKPSSARGSELKCLAESKAWLKTCVKSNTCGQWVGFLGILSSRRDRHNFRHKQQAGRAVALYWPARCVLQRGSVARRTCTASTSGARSSRLAKAEPNSDPPRTHAHTVGSGARTACACSCW